MEESSSHITASSAPEAEFHTWKFPGSPKRVHISLDVAEKLRKQIMEIAQTPDLAGTEIGGLLLGSPASKRGGVEIRDFQPLPCESRKDGRFALTTPADLERLDEAISAPRDGLAVVGFYRSHLRDGLSLDDRDLTVCQIWFSDPSQVFLLIRPEADGSYNAGFFFWDQNKIHSAFSFLEFPFEPELLRSMNAMESSLDEAAMTAAREVPTPPAEPPPEKSVRPKQSTLGWVIAACLVVLAIALGVSFDVFQKMANLGSAEKGADQTSVLGLQVVTRGSDLMVSWNRNSPPVKTARSGALQIRDGDQPMQEIPLDAAQLRGGSVLYAPSGDRVQFRLEVEGDQKVYELVLALIKGRVRPDESQMQPEAAPRSPGRQPGVQPPAQNLARVTVPSSARPPAQNLTQPGVPTQAPLVAAPDQAKSAGAETSTAAAPARTVRTFIPPPQDNSTVEPVRTVYVEPPTIQGGTTSLASSPPLATLSTSRMPDPPPAAPAPKPVPVAKETPPVVQSLPAQVQIPPRVVEAKPESLPYVQPRPIRQAAPSVSLQLLRALITKDTQVEVKAYVDATGRVTRADVVSTNFHRLLTTAVTDAARKWAFEPARMGGKPVAGEAKIVFLFRAPTGGQ